MSDVKTPLCRKELFQLPDDIVYLDGNSLGPLPGNAVSAMTKVTEAEWGAKLITGWNQCGWMEQPTRIGDKIARLIGAQEGSVVLGDTLSIKVFQALSAALELRPERRVILSDTGNFPTDLYMAEGLIRLKDKGYTLMTVDPEEVAEAIDESIAVVMLTEVDYRTGRKHAMEEVTAKAHQAGAVMIWDLAHSAGAVEVDLAKSGCEFAVGCTYKYLNGGPGAPAFIYVRPDLQDNTEPSLSGWLGHEKPFAFDVYYRPAQNIERMRVGTPPVLQMAALEASLEIWEEVDMTEVRETSLKLSELFITLVEEKCPELKLASPRDPRERGSQVSFTFEHGYAAIQALISEGVIGDFRAPDIMRFGITPLYLDESDIKQAAATIERVIRNRLWDTEKFRRVQRVT